MGRENVAGLDELFQLFDEKVTLADINASKYLGKISAAIVQRRIDLKMTQKEFAEYVDVSQSMVSKWESEDYNFTIESLAQIAEKLELNLEISLTPESDQYRKIQRRESKCEWNGNIWKNKYKGNIVELNRAV